MQYPIRCNLRIIKKAHFDHMWSWKTQDPQGVLAPMDLTGCTASLLVTDQMVDGDTLFELTTDNGGLTIGGSEGTIRMDLDAVATDVVATRGVYSLFVTLPSKTVVCFATGRVAFKEVRK